MRTEPIVSEKRRTGAPMSNREEVDAFLSAFARAVTSGDTAVITALWETPAFVISDEGVRAVSSPKKVEAFFAGAKDQYNAKGIVDTKPEVMRLEWQTDKIATVEVRFPYLDAAGCERGYETSTYVLRRDDTGALRLRTAIMHGASEP
jgi:hypothetical protein